MIDSMFPDIEEFNFLMKAKPEENTFAQHYFCPAPIVVDGNEIYLHFEKEEKDVKLLCSVDTYNLIKMINWGRNNLNIREKAYTLADKYNNNIKKKYRLNFTYHTKKRPSIYFNLYN